MTGKDEVTRTLEDLALSLKRLTRVTILAYVLLALMGALGGFFVYQDQRIELQHVAFETATALCALRTDIEVKVDNSTVFLQENPEGIPGISPALIQSGIVDQERTLEALGILTCPPVLD